MILFMKNGNVDATDSIKNIRKMENKIAFVLYPLKRDFDKFYMLVSPSSLARNYKKFKIKYSISLFAGDADGSKSTSDEIPISRYSIFKKNIKIETGSIDIFLNAVSLLMAVNHMNEILNNPFESGTYYNLFSAHDIKISVEFEDGTEAKFDSGKLKPYFHPAFNCTEVYSFDAINDAGGKLYEWISDFFGQNTIVNSYGFDFGNSVLSIKKKKWYYNEYAQFVNPLASFKKYSWNYFIVTPWLFHEVKKEVIPFLESNPAIELDLIVFDHEDTMLSYNNSNIESIIPNILEDDMGDIWHIRDYIENIADGFFEVFNIDFQMFAEYQYFARLLMVSRFITEFAEYATRILYGTKYPETIFTLKTKNQSPTEYATIKKKLRGESINSDPSQLEMLFMDSNFITLENFITGCKLGDLVSPNMEVYTI